MAPLLRHLSSKDIDKVYEVAQKTLKPLWSRNDYLYFLERHDAFNLGAFEDSELTSFILALMGPDEMDIVAVATAPHFQHRGYASLLVNHVIVKNQKKQMILEVDKTNQAAVRLYLKCGFKVVGIRKKYYEGKRDAWLMRWERD